MKTLFKLLTLLILLLSFPALAQLPASGVVTMFASRPLGTHTNGVIYTGFTIPTLPAGAVVVGIYPSVVVSTPNANVSITTANWGSDITYGLGGPTGSPISSGVNNSPYGRTQFSDGSSIGTVLPSPNPGIFVGLNASLFLNNLTDLVNILGVGYAVYYTAPHPLVDRLMAPPIGVPIGQGIAWSIPTSLAATGFTDTGTAVGSLGNPNPQGYESLTGIVKIPDANNFNGFLSIKLNSNSIQNICNSPFLSVPTRFSTYPIVNGVPVGLSSVLYATQDCMSPRIPYYVEISDTNHIVQSTDNWYVPYQAGGSVDIGDLQESKFTGPITVAIPQAIISTPTNNQTITQPVGTSLTINGTVNLTGTVNFTNPLSFSVLNATKVLVNGASGTSAPLDVNGFANASAGYLVGGSGGVVGQALVSDGVSFKPGSVAVVFPTLFYQNVSLGGVFVPQRTALNFDSTVFSSGDSSGPSVTTIGFLPVGTPGTYSNVTGITTDLFGRVTNVASGTTGSTIPRTCNSNGCYRKESDGTFEMWGTSSAIATGSNNVTASITFPTTFTTTSNLVVVVTSDACTTAGCSNSAVTTSLVTGSLTTSTVQVRFGSAIVIGGAGSNFSGTIHANWHAWGQ